MRLLDWLKSSAASAERWWFDVSHGVKTAGYVPVKRLTLAGSAQGAVDYIPVLYKNVRSALNDVPAPDLSPFTFVDLGSGKGPALFIAAEYPFRKIRGVEFAKELHDQAVANIASYHSKKQRCRDIESIYMDVREFEFPEDDLLVYCFNSFDPPILERALSNLGASLQRKPREVFLLSLFPEPLAPVLQSLPWLRPERTTPRHHIYRAIRVDAVSSISGPPKME